MQPPERTEQIVEENVAFPGLRFGLKFNWPQRRNANFRPRSFDPAAEKVGLLGLTPHKLRHTAANLAIAAAPNVKAVQLTLDIYTGLFADDLDAVADRLDRAFVKLNADQMRTKRRTSRSDQTELPFENPPEQGTG